MPLADDKKSRAFRHSSIKSFVAKARTAWSLTSRHHHHTAEVTSYMYLLVAEKASTITMFPDILLER